MTQSRDGTHWSGAQYPRDALFKGRNIQELSVRDTSVGDISTLHRLFSGAKCGPLVEDSAVNLKGATKYDKLNAKIMRLFTELCTSIRAL